MRNSPFARWMRTRHTRVAVGSTIALICLQQSPARGDEPSVLIAGGTVDGGHKYDWTVTNEGKSPIVYVEFPHYRANLFFAPDGWSTKGTNLVQVGSKDIPGICTATADSPTGGINPGRSAAFRMQVGDPRAKPRPGTILVRFADGTELSIDGVEIPLPETVGDKYMTLIGLGSIFLIWMVLAGVRRRRSGKQPSSDRSSQQSE